MEINKCFAGYCKWRAQGVGCVQCTHSKAIHYRELKEFCEVCGRKPNETKNGCGACIGRGEYIYSTAYEDCDCGGYEVEGTIYL